MWQFKSGQVKRDRGSITKTTLKKIAVDTVKEMEEHAFLHHSIQIDRVSSWKVKLLNSTTVKQHGHKITPTSQFRRTVRDEVYYLILKNEHVIGNQFL